MAAARGHAVTVIESAPATGGLAAVAGPNRALVDWQAAELARFGVEIRLGTTEVPADAEVVVQCTGSRLGAPTYEIGERRDHRHRRVARGTVALPADGVVALLDPIGGPVAVSLAEELGARAVLVTQDHIAGNELARTGDLAPANVRLAQRGVRIERRTTVDAVERQRRRARGGAARPLHRSSPHADGRGRGGLRVPAPHRSAARCRSRGG